MLHWSSKREFNGPGYRSRQAVDGSEVTALPADDGRRAGDVAAGHGALALPLLIAGRGGSDEGGGAGVESRGAGGDRGGPTGGEREGEGGEQLHAGILDACARGVYVRPCPERPTGRSACQIATGT